MRLKSTEQKDSLTKDNGLIMQGCMKMMSTGQKDRLTQDNRLMMQGCMKQMSRGQVELHSSVSSMGDRQPIAAFRSKTKMGAIKDVAYFSENDFSQNVRHRELPSRYNAGNACTYCNACCWKEEQPGFCCEKGNVHLDTFPLANLKCSSYMKLEVQHSLTI